MLTIPGALIGGSFRKPAHEPGHILPPTGFGYGLQRKVAPLAGPRSPVLVAELALCHRLGPRGYD